MLFDQHGDAAGNSAAVRRADRGLTLGRFSRTTLIAEFSCCSVMTYLGSTIEFMKPETEGRPHLCGILVALA